MDPDRASPLKPIGNLPSFTPTSRTKIKNLIAILEQKNDLDLIDCLGEDAKKDIVKVRLALERGDQEALEAHSAAMSRGIKLYADCFKELKKRGNATGGDLSLEMVVLKNAHDVKFNLWQLARLALAQGLSSPVNEGESTNAG